MKKFIVITIILACCLSVTSVYALDTTNPIPSDWNNINGEIDSSNAASISNPLGPGVTPNKLIGKLITSMLGIVGSLALVMFIYGGFTWMLAAGNADAVSKGKNILIWATIGLVVIFSSYALLQFVFTSIGV